LASGDLSRSWRPPALAWSILDDVTASVKPSDELMSLADAARRTTAALEGGGGGAALAGSQARTPAGGAGLASASGLDGGVRLAARARVAARA